MKSTRAVERTKKKLQEQQVSYWMAVPSLPLRLYGDNGKVQIALMHTCVVLYCSHVYCCIVAIKWRAK